MMVCVTFVVNLFVLLAPIGTEMILAIMGRVDVIVVELLAEVPLIIMMVLGGCLRVLSVLRPWDSRLWWP